MKKILSVFCMVLMVLCCSTLVGCKEELTYNESQYVGTWVLEDITKIGYLNKPALKYPSNNVIFNELCEKYLSKTKINLSNNKKDGYILGEFIVGKDKIEFDWKVDDNPRKIELKDALKLYTLNKYNEYELDTGYVGFMSVIDNKLAILENYVIYTFFKK